MIAGRVTQIKKGKRQASETASLRELATARLFVAAVLEQARCRCLDTVRRIAISINVGLNLDIGIDIGIHGVAWVQYTSGPLTPPLPLPTELRALTVATGLRGHQQLH